MVTPPRIEKLSVKNLRSVGDPGVSINFSAEGPVVLLGENNTGKTNITRALNIVFGEAWPGSRRLDEHDFHNRDSDGIAIEIFADVSGIVCPCQNGMVSQFKWVYDAQNPAPDGNPVTYRMQCTSSYCTRTYPSNFVRSSLLATVIDSNRRLDYQLSYASKFTMLSKLMRRFHEKLLDDVERKENLTRIFDALINEFGAVPEFAYFKQLLASTAEDLGQNLAYRLDIDFSAYDPSNFFRSLRVTPSLSGEVRNFDELGTGQSQILALAFAFAYARAYGQSEGTILVIDEPEANLHPLAQQWLANRLSRMAEPGLQIILTTHSPYFVDIAKPQNLVMVSKSEEQGTQATQRTLTELQSQLVEQGADSERTQPNTIGPFYAAGATTEILSGLFARRCVLVEGRTEALALPELLRHRGLDVLKEGIAIVSVDGIGNIAKWHRLYTALGIECYSIFDTDANKTGSDARRLANQRRDIGKAVGVMEDPAAGLIPDSMPLIVKEKYAMMHPNFEGAMSTLFGSTWGRLYEAATDMVGDSKPLRARQAVKQLVGFDFYGEQTIAPVDELIKRIRGLPDPPQWIANYMQETQQQDNAATGNWNAPWPRGGFSPQAPSAPNTWGTPNPPNQQGFDINQENDPWQ